MFGSSIIDIAIGVGFVYLLLSLIASTINEIILSLLNMRGKDLLRGLKTLLDDEHAEGLVKDLYNHGLIFGLFRGSFDPKKTGELPSYIPRSNFVMALLDVARVTAGQPITVQEDAAATMASLKAAAQKLAGDTKTAKVGKPLVSMIDIAGTDLTKLRKSVGDWYDSAMDRVSGAYKYRTQKILFVLGLILAAGLNANTVTIIRQLSTDSTLRQSIVAAAQSEKQPDGMAGQPRRDQIRQVEGQVSQLGNIGIPVGWAGAWPPCKPPCEGCAAPCTGPHSFGGWLAYWARSFGGWLLTAIAISLGAPFWFDLLNKFMIVRSTVRPSEKSGEGEYKGKKEVRNEG